MGQGGTHKYPKMQRQRHKGKHMKRKPEAQTLTCKPRHIQDHTHCCTRTLKELQLQLEWYVIKPHRTIHSPTDPTRHSLQRARPQQQGGLIPLGGLSHQLLTRGPVVPKEFHLQCLPRLLSKSQGCGGLRVP